MIEPVRKPDPVAEFSYERYPFLRDLRLVFKGWTDVHKVYPTSSEWFRRYLANFPVPTDVWEVPAYGNTYYDPQRNLQFFLFVDDPADDLSFSVAYFMEMDTSANWDYLQYLYAKFFEDRGIEYQPTHYEYRRFVEVHTELTARFEGDVETPYRSAHVVADYRPYVWDVFDASDQPAVFPGLYMLQGTDPYCANVDYGFVLKGLSLSGIWAELNELDMFKEKKELYGEILFSSVFSRSLKDKSSLLLVPLVVGALDTVRQYFEEKGVML